MKKWIFVLGAVALTAVGTYELFKQNDVEKTMKREVVDKNAPLFYDGKGFYTYKKPLDEDVLKNGKLKAVFFFDYNCQNCISADDYLKQYAKFNPEKIELVRYPYFKDGKVFVAKMHAALELIGKPELSDLYLFDSAGKNKDDSLTESDAAVKIWLENHGVDLAKFNQLWQSEMLKKQVEVYANMYRKYRPISAPFVSINGKYVLVHNTLYNDDYTYAVLNHLYENHNNPAVLDYKAPKPEESKKETK